MKIEEFKELSGLAESINTMIIQIRNQIEILEEEIAKKRAGGKYSEAVCKRCLMPTK